MFVNLLMIMMKKKVWLGNSHRKEVWDIEQSNRRHIWWHIWRGYNLTRHAIQVDTWLNRRQWQEMSDPLSSDLCTLLVCKLSSSLLVTRSQNPIGIPSAPILIFSLLRQVYPKSDQDYNSDVSSTTCGDVWWVFINREVRVVPYKALADINHSWTTVG